MNIINLQNIRQAESLQENLYEIRAKIEHRINLDKYSEGRKSVILNNSKIMRICLIAGLSSNETRQKADFENIQLSPNRIFETLFTHHNLATAILALVKIRYNAIKQDWKSDPESSRIINAEILRGSRLLLNDNVLEDWLLNTVNSNNNGKMGDIPLLNLNIGVYEDNIPALLNLNGRDISNTQTLIAGTTGSGKSNLLAVLLNEIRTLSIESNYPVNFLFFDYKGEFSDIANND